ncbi:MAG: TlyA family RNA methyltransferase [Holdemanella sp.]|nr:TlyA family RNA methyltransferase [Holdemanella sp.]
MKIRLDKACLSQMSTRAKAQDAIKEGRVCVNGKVITKCGFLIEESDEIKIESKDDDFVSRAGHKLEAAFQAFSFSIENEIVLDIGASTGGFTDVCLRHGAKKVYALDVGHLQLAKELDEDDRVIKMEGRNARETIPEWFEDEIDFICMDVSFISAKTILEQIFKTLSFTHMAILIKPQFECGPAYLDKHGVLKNEKIRNRIVEDMKAYILTEFESIQVIPSPIQGRSGNQEYIVYAKKRRCKS